MKKLFLAIILSIFLNPALADTIQPVQLDVRDYNAIKIPAGSFFGVESAQEISTQYCQNGYKVRFIASNDFYIDDTKVVPENTTFIGYVEDVHDPIIGTNGSFKVRITKMILSDGFEIPVKGYIYSSNENTIGGEMSAPAQWRKMPHYQWNIGDKTTLQVRPGRMRSLGTHAVILSGEDRIIVLTEPLSVTHTLSD